MAESCRFAFAVHILAMLAHQPEGGVNSERIAGSVNTNPVVVRRILSALKHAGLVCCVKGAGGGASLARPPKEIGLDAIYRAIEPERSLAGKRHHPNRRCPVGREIKSVLEEVYAAAQGALEASLAKRTLADAVKGIPDAASGRGLSANSRKTKAA